MANANAKSIHARAMAGEKVTLDWMETPDEDAVAAKAAADAKAADPVEALKLQVAELKGQIAGSLQPKPIITGWEPRPNLQTEVDLTKLPNPAEDGEGYAKALQAQMDLVARNRQELGAWSGRQSQAVTKASDKLFSKFSKAHPDFAKNRKAVEFFANEAAEEAAASRVDVAQYMFGNSDQFFSDVVEKMKEAGFGAKALEKEDSEGEEPDNRALGIPAGGEGSGGKTPKVDTVPASMMKTLGAWQQKTGFHP